MFVHGLVILHRGVNPGGVWGGGPWAEEQQAQGPGSRSRLGRFKESKKAHVVGAEGAERRRVIMRSVRRWGWGPL